MPLIKNNVRSVLNLGTSRTHAIYVTTTKSVVMELIINSSCAVFDNLSLSSLTCAQARIPYVGIPREATIEK